jgi:hypothetical protein
MLRLAGGPPASLASRLGGDVLLGVSLATGACRPGQCTLWERACGPALLALLAAAGCLATAALLRARARPTDPAGRPDPARECARLALVVAAGLTVLAYLHDPAAARTPMESARYLGCLPAALWPLWTLTARIRPAAVRRLGVAALTAAVAVSLGATVALARDAGRVGAAATRQERLIRALDAAGVTRLYSEYWTCARLSYARERIACAVVSDDCAPAGTGTGRWPARCAPSRAPATCSPPDPWSTPPSPVTCGTGASGTRSPTPPGTTSTGYRSGSAYR